MSFGSSQRHKMFLGARPGPCSLALRHSAPRCDARIEAEGVAESQLRRRPAPPRAERAPLHCSPARPLGYRRASSSWASRRSSTPWSTCGRSYLCPSSRRCSVQPSSAPSSRSRAPVDSSVSTSSPSSPTWLPGARSRLKNGLCAPAPTHCWRPSLSALAPRSGQRPRRPSSARTLLSRSSSSSRSWRPRRRPLTSLPPRLAPRQVRPRMQRQDSSSTQRSRAPRLSPT
mmetsp:Transcript_224/g.941  ORF Transcript_224/g.941 Transcript_224/m.941 type:complete len:229 (-) Transcript_224:1468-2154(-)